MDRASKEPVSGDETNPNRRKKTGKIYLKKLNKPKLLSSDLLSMRRLFNKLNIKSDREPKTKYVKKTPGEESLKKSVFMIRRSGTYKNKG